VPVSLSPSRFPPFASVAQVGTLTLFPVRAEQIGAGRIILLQALEVNDVLPEAIQNLILHR
jgi:hypothetical protein